MAKNHFFPRAGKEYKPRCCSALSVIINTILDYLSEGMGISFFTVMAYFLLSHFTKWGGGANASVVPKTFRVEHTIS